MYVCVCVCVCVCVDRDRSVLHTFGLTEMLLATFEQTYYYRKNKTTTSYNAFNPGIEDFVLGFGTRFFVPEVEYASVNPAMTVFRHDGSVVKEKPAGEVLYMSVTELMQATGVNLDSDNIKASEGSKVSPIQYPIFRLSGARLGLKFELDNVASFGNDVSVTLKFTRKDSWTYLDNFYERIEEGHTEKIVYGLWFSLDVDGNVGHFDFSTLLTAIVSCLVLMKVALVITEIFVTKVYKHRHIINEGKFNQCELQGGELQRKDSTHQPSNAAELFEEKCPTEADSPSEAILLPPVSGQQKQEYAKDALGQPRGSELARASNMSRGSECIMYDESRGSELVGAGYESDK